MTFVSFNANEDKTESLRINLLNRVYESEVVVYFRFTDGIYVLARVTMVTRLEFKNYFHF